MDALHHLEKKSMSIKAKLILLANLVLILFPPIHWIVGQGSMSLSLGYFVFVPLFVMVSFWILHRIEP